MKKSSNNQKWDVFISHASEDKATFVEPLAKALAAFGVTVWYDSFSLKLGDSLSRSIDQGLANAQFGLVVLSPAFIAKRWPEYELRGLTAREMTGGKIILPIWHHVSKEDILAFSPPLADKLAIQSSEGTPVEIAVKIIEIVRPDILTHILRRIAYYEALAKGKLKSGKIKDLKPSPIQHKELPPDLISRIRLIRASLLGAYTHSMDYWKDGFQRDAHPTKEIAHWEHFAAVYREYTSMAPPLSPEQHIKIFELIMGLSVGATPKRLEKIIHALPENAYDVIKNLYSCAEPIYDIEEKLPFAEAAEPSDDTLSYFESHDKEVFPKDLPEDMIRALMQEKGDEA